MSTTGLKVFDETLHLTNSWLKSLMDRLGTDDRHQAYLGLRTTLHALRDLLPPELAIHLGAELPMLVRGFYYEGWKPSRTPVRERSPQEFLRHVDDAMNRDPGTAVDAEEVVRAVFALLGAKLAPGEVDKVRRTLPHGIRDLWPDAGER